MARQLARDIYWPLVFPVIGLCVVGTLFIYSASYHDAGAYETRQFFWIVVGFLALLGVPLVGYRTFLSVSYLLYVISLFFLVAVLVFGKTRLGAQRWLSFGPIIFQPSEFAKLAIVLALANFLGSHNRWEKETRVVVTAMALVLVPVLLVMKQPDLGSALLFLPMMFVMFFLWGIRYRYLVGFLVAGLVGTPFLWSLLKEYQRQRILVFLDPSRDPLGAGYTAIQSKIAVGAGGLFGKGYLHGTQSQLQFVPEHHTDFIFCVIGEEWGFAGTFLILCLYAWLFSSCLRVMEQTTDMKARLLGGGIVGLLFAQVFINLGMTIGITPITGVTLPLVSYGGSSFVMTSIALGLILSIYKERSIF